MQVHLCVVGTDNPIPESHWWRIPLRSLGLLSTIPMIRVGFKAKGTVGWKSGAETYIHTCEV